MVSLMAKDIMNTDVLSVGSDWSISQLADFLLTNSITGAPVISEENKLVGVVSMTDLVRHTSLPGVDTCTDQEDESYIHPHEMQISPDEIETSRIDAQSLVSVRDIMTPVTFNVNEYTRIQDVADAMMRGRIHRVFVTRDESLVGIITTMDLLSAVRDL
jgi:CBS domain-containing protein